MAKFMVKKDSESDGLANLSMTHTLFALGEHEYRAIELASVRGGDGLKW